MDLSVGSIHDVIHPTAAFSGDRIGASCLSIADVPCPDWGNSVLNPKNRIDSLDVPKGCCWRIDGCTGFGGQFYAIPLFIQPLPPIRVDVFIPEPSKLPIAMREVLDIDGAFHTRDASRVLQLGLTKHILRILHHWSVQGGHSGGLYDQLPFGSRIVFENLPKNISEAQISIAPTHNLERQLLSVTALQAAWGCTDQLPAQVDFRELDYISQLHDSVCLVRHMQQVWIFKALTSYTKYLYHELRQLLLLPNHPNIIQRPTHLVTKECVFGSKIAVVGFMLEYHPHGSLRDLVPFLRMHGMVSLEHETRWALQLASSLVCIREEKGMFYPDLRLDNIVLSKAFDVVMVDFEQRGVWCEFAAPEVNAIEYVRLLAIDEEIPNEATQKYARILNQMLPGWESMGEGEAYSWPNQGFNIPWTCLTPTEQEACEVYMLGRVLWCIFEGASAPQRAAVWLSYRWEPAVEFPEYTSTPQAMRELIDHCTRGRRPGLSKHIVREGNQLVTRELEGTGKSKAAQVQDRAREWWRQELAYSEDWLSKRSKGLQDATWEENYYGRPTLRQVYDAVRVFRREQGFTEFSRLPPHQAK